MRRNLWLLALGLAAAIGLGLWLDSDAGPGAFPSALSRGREGLLAARLYLEAQGIETRLLDHPVESDLDAAALVVAFPWRRPDLELESTALLRWVRNGGTLIVGYSGKVMALDERRFFEAWGIERSTLRTGAPLSPLAWRQYQQQHWTLVPLAPATATQGAIELPAFDVLPLPPADATVLYELAGAGIEPHGDQAATKHGAVWSLARGRGRLLVLPAAVLTHEHLRQPGAAELLAALAATLPGAWAFDEYHQGLSAETAARAEVSLLPLDLFFLHLAVIYGLAVWALARRFGPPWREPRARLGSSGSFLLGLGRLHDRSGHHSAAAALLLARAKALQPALAEPRSAGEGRDWSELEAEAASANRAGFLRLARELAERRGAKS